MLFKNKCAWCGEPIASYAINRQGDLPTVYCSSTCETKDANHKRLKETKVFKTIHRGINTEELTKRMSKKGWSGYQYNSVAQEV